MRKPRTHLSHLAIVAGLILAIGLLLATVFPAQAVEFTNDGIIEAGEVVDDDLFIEANDARIDGTVNGDLFISSNTAVVNGVINGNLIVTSAFFDLSGEVNGSLVFAGQNAIINGQVNGTIYAASADMQVKETANVTRNLFYAGYSLNTETGSKIGQDIAMTGYQLILEGEAGRDVRCEGYALEVNGKVGRDVIANVDEPNSDEIVVAMPFLNKKRRIASVPSGLRVNSTAQIGGKLAYTSPVDQSDAIQATPQGGIYFTRYVQETAKTVPVSLRERLALWTINRVQELATLLILGALAIWAVPVLMRRLGDQARSQPLPALGWGVVTLLGGFASVGLLFGVILITGILTAVITLGGLSRSVFGIGFSVLGIAFGIFMFMLQYGSKLAIAHLGGRMILQRFSPAAAEHRVWPLMLGVFLYVLLSGIPLLGWLFGLLVTLLGLGAAWILLREWWNIRLLRTQGIEVQGQAPKI